MKIEDWYYIHYPLYTTVYVSLDVEHANTQNSLCTTNVFLLSI